MCKPISILPIISIPTFLSPYLAASRPNPLVQSRLEICYLKTIYPLSIMSPLNPQLQLNLLGDLNTGNWNRFPVHDSFRFSSDKFNNESTAHLSLIYPYLSGILLKFEAY